jgi:hypothetical protein
MPLICCQVFAAPNIILSKLMLENTEGTIKKGQSRETGNIGYTRRRKQNKAQHNIQLRPSVYGNIQISQPEGGVVFPSNCFIIFLPMFYRLSPLGGKLGCSAGNNTVVSQQRKCCQYLIGYLPCGGKLGSSAVNSRCSSAGNNRVVSRQRKFWQNISITIIFLSPD